VATHFLNVDLDLYSGADLQPLQDALGRKVDALHIGRQKGTYEAHFELASPPTSADSGIRRFCSLVRSLPPAERKLWDAAKVRDFSVGIQVEALPRCQDFALAAETLQAAAALNARIVFSIYAPDGVGAD
jgi:hypothetical protein